VAATFDDDTALEPLGDGRWSGRIERSWWVQRGPNGGYVAAIVLRGMALAVDDDERHPRSLTVHYLEPPDEGPVEVEVTLERQGRGLTTATARLLQDERTIALAIGAFARERETSVAFDDAVMPTLLPERDRPSLGPLTERPPLHAKWDTTPAIGGDRGSGAPAESGGFLRLAEDGRQLDALVAAAAMDAWIPPIFVRHAGPVGVPTVDLTIHFLRPLPHPGTDADTRYVCRFATEVAAGGHLVESGELWSPDGTLLVVSRQLAVAVG
jgi:acyl-CoA thioesterase